MEMTYYLVPEVSILQLSVLWVKEECACLVGQQTDHGLVATGLG